ncbi:Adenylate cyclase, class 3 [Yoonia rosea]|uniref:guanylate cyclase n=1 Tax=Yoonia rosea TaxID=287098 RepID=A0A1R3WZK1_9RHOB|nr:adenylate/guanylate cyclase domain-containing protein [Yoonia rosea]SIT83949.1 Adenylate cyclase, class 3 [Yoonia rosea]
MTHNPAPQNNEVLRLQRRLAKSDMRRAELEHLIDTGQAFQRSVLAQVEKAKAELQKLNEQLQQEQARSDKLLRSIMPNSIAEELKRNDGVTPRRCENATVMFADFVGFTAKSETLDPLVLLQVLDYYYSEFDRITARHSIEKVKTIGDAYMCVAGLNDDPASTAHVIAAAQEFLSFVAQARPPGLDAQAPLWQIRIGINSGPVSTGVIGQERLSFDVWGDTVNIASRIVNASTPNEIRLSSSSIDLLTDKSSFAYCGQVNAKGRGMIDLFCPA